ncbi:hypothetical protein [Streptomyces sp. AM6-12]|uniref:hypothetical protein n=1 Tax=Streptomyces sp. AM6-12 TaxID=3345149 RepID=UPI0037905F29
MLLWLVVAGWSAAALLALSIAVLDVSDFHRPVTGEVVAINTDATDAPSEVHRDAYGVRLFKTKLAGAGAFDGNHRPDGQVWIEGGEQLGGGSRLRQPEPGRCAEGP